MVLYLNKLNNSFYGRKIHEMECNSKYIYYFFISNVYNNLIE